MANVESTLAAALQSKLARDARTTGLPIEVIDNNGVITLSGIVLSVEARAAAAAIALNHPGVLCVINDLEVDPDATTELRIVVPLPASASYQN